MIKLGFSEIDAGVGAQGSCCESYFLYGELQLTAVQHSPALFLEDLGYSCSRRRTAASGVDTSSPIKNKLIIP